MRPIGRKEKGIMENKVLKKIIIFVTVFMLVFSNCGYTLQALAATDGITLFGFNLFGSGNIDFDAYFLDENGKKQAENIGDVNSEMTMVLEFTPKTEGYLKTGIIKAVNQSEGEVNFKFDEVFVDDNSNSDLTKAIPADTTLLQSEMTLDLDKIELNPENSETKEKSKNEIATDNTAKVTNTVSETNETMSENVIEENTVVSDNTVSQENVVKEETVINSSDEENFADLEVEEEFVDEENALNEKDENKVLISNNLAKATRISDSEIQIENIIESTKVYVNISFKTDEKLNVEDLYKQIKLELEGTYINTNLEELPISLAEELKVGWKYSKDIEVSSEYTKISPFKIGETKGTILENTIIVKRDVTDDNYLPLKQTEISVEVPTLGEKVPTELNVKALKLKATNGQDINEVSFSNENWEYDANNNTLNITVENKDGVFTYGEDVYVVTYRYDTYVEETEVSIETKGTVKVVEFSGKDNNEIVKNLDNSQKIVANVGELITYSIGTTEEKIEKAKINANYNGAEEKYESEFDTTVSVNILTNDVLNEFTLKDTKEFYIDKEGLEFESNDVKYKNIKFRYDEISSLLENGGIIEIKNNNGELLYTLNKDLVKSDSDSEISIQGDVRGIEISFKNITVNGNINIKFTKAIGKSSYEKAAFANFKKLESKINAVVKYSEDSAETALEQIKTEKEFEESRTAAEITMNKVGLSTTEINENVEFKIELNNDKEDSDLYVNPVFEITLPKYVSNIDIKSSNILYEAGLSIGNTTIYRAEDGTQRIRIEINGTQTEFSQGTITNGTNIIINTNIELDKYAPRKDEQIKLYYINEGVTNYTSQTKWTIGKEVPTGILKTTNGFDSYVFKINAPSGFVTVNEVQNYDGQNSVVTSIKQGTETREVEMGKSAQVARMNLIAINNTENECTDVAFLGRIPVKDVTDVKTGEKLETNINATMISRITENAENPLSAKIYYSSNPNADKNLSDSSNGWTEEFSGVSDIKSFLIVPDNTIEPGYTFKYTYEFIIPDNLPYEAKMYGSFGAFYNNHSDVAITYESSSADLVGVVTKSGPKIEATLSVDVGDGAEVKEASFLNYTLTVANSGSLAAENVTITNPIPEGTKLYENVLKEETGRYGWFEAENQDSMVWNIEKLEPGEVKEFNYTLKTTKSPTDEMITIKNKATVKVSNLALDINSNEIKNKLSKSNFDIDVFSNTSSTMMVQANFEFMAKATNISGEDLHNVTLEYKLPEEVLFTSCEAGKNDKYEAISEDSYEYDEENNIFTLEIPEWKSGEIFNIAILTKVISGNVNKVGNIISFIKDNNEKESSRSLDVSFRGPKLEASQVCSIDGNTVKEGEEVEFVISIENNGNGEAKETSIYSTISENLEDVNVSLTGSTSGNLELTNSNELVSTIHSIPEDEVVNVHVSGVVKDVDDDNKTISSKLLITNDYAKDINTNEITLQVLNDPNRQVVDKKDDRDNIFYDSDFENNNTNTEPNIAQTLVNNQESTNIQNNNSNESQDKQNSSQTQEEKNQANTTVEQDIQKHSISGRIWLDINKNGIFEDDEKGISGVQVQLQKDNMSIKATVSPKDGSYSFRDLEAGTYGIVYTYDDNQYVTTVYKNVENGVERASYARGVNNGQAITDAITLGNANIDNINLGLQERDNFDLTISKSITLAKVTTNGKTTEHKYKNLDLAKLEISAKDLDKSTVELHYKVVVKNEGNVSGKVIQIADYLPKDTTLNTEQSKDWYLGNDGNVYNDSLAGILIAPGETRTLDLVLIRNMTSENTGVLGNKVAITKTEGTTDSIVENSVNNDATQELIISVRTGYTAPIIINAIIITCLVAIIYLQKKQKIKLDFKNLKIKRIYK